MAEWGKLGEKNFKEQQNHYTFRISSICTAYDFLTPNTKVQTLRYITL